MLIVDDSREFVEFLRTLLSEHEGIEVAGLATSKTEALRVARAVKPSVILLDVWLTDGSSIAILPELINENPRAQIIVMTSAPSETLKRRCLEMGAYRFFDKNEGLPALVDCVVNLPQ